MKKSLLAVLFLFMTLPSPLSMAEELAFQNYSTKVSHLELELKLFDFAVKHLHILSDGPLSYLSSISSHAFTNKRIDCWAFVSESIMEGAPTEKKKRIIDFCNALFIEYQRRFLMTDLGHQKKPGDIEQPSLPMKPSNLKIYIHTFDNPPKFLAEWASGNISYKDAFLSDN